MTTKKNPYGKIEKLKSKKDIQHLFKKGKHISSYPLRAMYIDNSQENTPINAGVSVSKRNIKLAVHRNLIKRRIREAYRLNNNELKNQLEINIMFIYSAKEILPYSLIEKKMKYLLAQLINRNEKHDE